jgi:hypothetical protein
MAFQVIFTRALILRIVLYRTATTYFSSCLCVFVVNIFIKQIQCVRLSPTDTPYYYGLPALRTILM